MKSKIRKDSHGYYIKYFGTIVRPQLSDFVSSSETIYSNILCSDAPPEREIEKLEEGQEVHIQALGVNIIRVNGATWYTHGPSTDLEGHHIPSHLVWSPA